MRATFFSGLALLVIAAGTAGPAPAAKARPAQRNDKGVPRAKDGATENPPNVSRTREIGGKSFDEWMTDLKDPDPANVENAIRTIILFGPDLAREAVPILIRKLDSQRLDLSVKVNIAIFLGMQRLDGDTLDEGVRGLNRMLISDQVIVRLHAALALARQGAIAKETIPRLCKNLEHYSWEIRKASALALASVAMPRSDKFPPDKVVVSALLRRMFVDKCAQVRVEAARALVMLGAGADQRDKVARDLKQVLRTERDKTVRIWSHVGVMRVTKIEEKRLDAIGKMLDDPVLGVKCEAARVLGLIGPEAKSQINRLRRVLGEDRDPIMRKAVIGALAEMGNAAKPAVKDLEAFASNTTDKNMKDLVQEAIKAIKAPKNDRRD
jgi:hypothetical protein